nr:hypothetical protein [Campylobacter jejuni]
MLNNFLNLELLNISLSYPFLFLITTAEQNTLDFLSKIGEANVK